MSKKTTKDNIDFTKDDSESDSEVNSNNNLTKSTTKKITKKTTKKITKKINSDEKEETQTIKPKSTRKKPVKKDEEKDEEKDEVDYSYLRLPDNEEIFKLKNDENEKNIKPILKMIDKAHNILFQAENIVGQKALQIIMNLLFLKLIQPYLSNKKEEGKIDLLNKEYYENKYEDEKLNKIFKYFTNLKEISKLPLSDIRSADENNDAIKEMGEILKRHPITKMIYKEANFLKINNGTTLQTLIDTVINNINFKDFEDNEDIIGEIYEHFLTKYVKSNSKELGQFFTPRKLMKLILKYKDNRIREIFSKININKKISICDPCMGTAGWLVSSFNMMNDFYLNRIELAGGEVEPDTFQYGLMNLILTTKKFPNDILCSSSLTHVNTNKHNLITTNPPFNSKTQIKFKQIKENFEKDTYTKLYKIKVDDIFKLQKDDPPIQFLELDTYKLEENGMCIIVLPYGEFFFKESYMKTREYFLKELNITDIILVPGGIFTHTNIKTCVLIFEKNKTGTNSINFLKVNDECNNIIQITNVKINDIIKEPYKSWYHSDYLNDKIIHDLSIKMCNFEWIEFNKIFKLEKGQLASKKIKDINDDENNEDNQDDNENDLKEIVIFVTGAKNENFKKIYKQEKSFLDGENIFISENGNGNKRPIKYFNGKCNYSNLMSVIHNINNINNINKKYIFYYLRMLQEHIEKNYQKGSCNQSLDFKNFNRIKIPIPPLEIQNMITIKIDSLDEKIKYIKLLINNMNENNINFSSIFEEINNLINNNLNKFIVFLEEEHTKL